MKYQVFVAGFAPELSEPPTKVLERVLRLDVERANALALRVPGVIAKGATREQAERLVMALQKAGVIVELREGEAAAPAQAAAPVSNRAAPPARAVPPPPPPAATARVSGGLTGTASAHKLAGPAASQASEKPPAQAPSAYALGELVMDVKPATPVPPAPVKSAPAPALSPEQPSAQAKPGEESLSFAGMQTLGNGFDEFDDVGPKIELEEAWRTQERLKGASGTAQPKTARAGSQSLQPQPAQPSLQPQPAKPVGAQLRQRIVKRLRSALDAFVSMMLGAWLVALIATVTLIATAYARNAENLLAQVGMDELSQQVALHGAPQHSAKPGDARAASQRIDKHPPSVPMHPLLPLVPAIARPAVATVLRSQISGIHKVQVVWPIPTRASVSCLLVEHRNGLTKLRLDELKKTGRALRIPRSVRAELRDQATLMIQIRGEPNIAITPICLTP